MTTPNVASVIVLVLYLALASIVALGIQVYGGPPRWHDRVLYGLGWPVVAGVLLVGWRRGRVKFTRTGRSRR